MADVDARDETGGVVRICDSGREGTAFEALAAANLACRFCTFRFRVSTLAESFFFSFNILRKDLVKIVGRNV